MTNNFLRVEFIGRLGRDPIGFMDPTTSELFAQFSVCIESMKRDPETDTDVKRLLWLVVIAGGELGKVCEKYLEKGRLIYASGTLIADKYGNPPKRSRDRYENASYEVLADKVLFLDPLGKGKTDNEMMQPALLKEEE